MTRLLFTLVATLATFTLFGQITFQRYIGSPQTNERAHYVLQLSDGGFLLAGSQAKPSLSEDALLIRLDADGNILWQKTYGGPSDDAFWSFVPGNDGGFVCVGETGSFGKGEKDVWLVKVNDAGEVTWSTTVGDIGRDQARDILAVPPSAYYLANSSESAAFDGFDAYLFKINNTGQVAWSKHFGNQIDNLTVQDFDASGHLLAGGIVQNGGNYEGIVMQLDTLGQMEWSRRYGLGALYYPFYTIDGHIVSSESSIHGSSTVAWMAKFDPITGVPIWSYTYGKGGQNYRSHAVETNDHGYVLILRNTAYGPVQSVEATAIKTDADGNLQWSHTYGNGPSVFYYGNPTVDNGFIFCGQGYFNGNDEDILLVKTDANGLVNDCCIHDAGIERNDLPRSPIDVVPVDDSWFTEQSQVLDAAAVSLNVASACTPFPAEDQTINFCTGDTVHLYGQSYTSSADVEIKLPGANGCDSIILYHLVQLSPTEDSKAILLLPGESVTILGVTYAQDTLLTVSLPGSAGECDTLMHFYIKTDPGFTDSCAQAAGFLKHYGNVGVDESAYTLCPAADGNLYLGGSRNRGIMLMKLSPSGHVLWARELEGTINDGYVSELIEDSDGMLAGTITDRYFSPGHATYAFRYDPIADTLLWYYRFTQLLPYAHGLLELAPGGNYLLNLQSKALTTGRDAELVVLDRATGQLVGGQGRHYHLHLGGEDNFMSMLAHDGSLYTIGQNAPQPAAGQQASDNLRCGLSRIDLTTFLPQWSRMSHVDTGATAKLIGRDLLMDQDTLVGVYYGSEAAGAPSFSFLQKTTRDGALRWVQRYTFDGSAEAEADEVLAVPDGYLLFGRLLDQGGVNFILKTDKNGEALWAKKLVNTIDPGKPIGNYVVQHGIQNQMLSICGAIYLVGTLSVLTEDVFLLKINTDGETGDNCGFLEPLDVTSSPVINPVNTAIPLILQGLPRTMAAHFAFPKTWPLPELTYCLHCDTLPLALSLGPDVSTCAGDSVALTATPGFLTYTWQDGSSNPTFPASAPGLYWVEVADACGGTQRDSIVLSLLPMPTDTALFEFCPGDFVIIDGQVYLQPGTVLDTLPSATGGCDTLAVYILKFLPQPEKTQVIEFCPGSSVNIGGTLYAQPGTVIDTLPATQGCDTLATFTLQYYTLPQPSQLTINCPASQIITAPVGANFVVVNYDLPVAHTDCVCGGASLSLNQGPVSGGNFPIGVNTVCYAAEDSCGTSQTCCFTVTVTPPSSPDTACDVKTVGCLQYELLGITANFHQDRKYRIRVTNTCAAKMIYTVFEVPQGETAMAPANNSVYAAPGGRQYDVRNPNYQPFYSIRFKSKTDSIANGESDIFEYQLPSQIAPSYIHVSSRLAPNTFYEAYLNTFHCPIENGAKPAGERGAFARQVSVYPNPTSGVIFANLSAWQGQLLRLRVLDAQGRTVWTARTEGGTEAYPIDLSSQGNSGLYSLEVLTENGERDVVRFVLEQ